MKETCRLCRKGTEVFLEPIFDYRDGYQIADIVMRVCPVEIITNDDFPKLICEECLEITMSAFSLQQTSVESENWYRSQLGNLDNLVVKKEKSETFVGVKVEQFSEDELNFDDTVEYSDEDSSNEPHLERVTTRSRTSFKPRELSSSKQTFTSEKWYQCNFCDTKLKPRSNMMRHMKRLHDPIVKPFACKFCVQRFEDEDTKQSHELIKHANETPLIIFCDVCGASGQHQEGMDRHKADDHKQKIETLHNEVFSEEETTVVRRRYRDKFNPQPVPGYESLPYEEVWYSCNFCDKQLKPRKSMLRHIRLKHDPEFLPNGCGICVERFETAEGLSEHVNEKHGNEAEQKLSTIFCEVCGISGNSKQGMNNHKADDHRLPFYSNPPEVPEGTVLLTRKRKNDFFNPRPLPGSENLKYEDIWYQCSFCEKQLKPRRVMLRHIRLKHDSELLPFGCRFCIRRFKTSEEFEQHESANHKNQVPEILFCDYCGVSGDNKEGMSVHLTDDHLRVTKGSTRQESFQFTCSKCDVKFKKREQLEQHYALHHTEKSSKCSKCDEKFKDKLLLRNHVMMVHDKLFRALEKAEVEQDLNCCACSEPFTNEQDLLLHVEVHRLNSTEVKCIHCPVPVKSYEVFMKHVRYHMKAKTHQCNQCKKIFSFDGKFICHVNSHKRNYRKKISCEKCGSKFRNQKELEIHDKVKHNKEILFFCPICAKSLGSATILDNHIKFVHNGDMEKKHECKVCAIKFTHKSKLVRHEATHSTLRPHICELCGAGFKMKEGLTIHMKRHAGTLVKNHHCNQCSYKFTTQHRLNVHKLTHSGAKPNACEYCDRAYASKGDLVKHLQKVHVGNAVYRCEKCPLAFPRIVELREHQTLHSQTS